ncbi:PP2C family protein-serine/threonine phosphatase [Saccharomonospora iraqiensis]|uniref:PP2C family protein-serine/threonine phosphatase n=1 Tax=Saccharomonospora iraqiensis TaxID=52698 RepID=UPI00022E7BD7
MDTAVNRQTPNRVPGQSRRRNDRSCDRPPDWAAVRFIQDSSHQLALSLNVRRTMLRALRLAVPYLGDWAMVAVFDDMGAWVVGGAEEASVDASVAPVPVGRLDPGSALPRIKRVGHTELRTARDDDLHAVLRDLVPLETLREQAESLEPSSVLAVGLDSGGTTNGVLVTVTGPDRAYTDGEVRLTEEFGRRVAVAVQSAKLYEERAEMAEALQETLRPPELPQYPEVRMAARYRSSSERTDIGGDFYDVHGAADDFTAVIGDVCGKGIRAAMLTGLARQTIKTAAHVDRSPSRVLRTLNEVLRTQPEKRFVSLACVRLRRGRDDGDLLATLAVAGHPPPLVLRRDGTVDEPDARGTVAGIVPNLSYDEVDFRLAPGETLLLYTDGVDEARGPYGFFGADRLRRLLPHYAGASPATVCEAVEQHVVEHIGGEGHDDIAVLAIRNES